MKRILVPCDFSLPAQAAFKFAVKLVEQSKGELHVLYVLDITFLNGNASLAHTYAFNLNFLKDMEKESHEKFQAMWEKYSPRTLPVKFRHTIGSLVPDVENYIREHDVDLVVMGTHGSESAAWGSNAEKIVRNSPVPVFAIRQAPDKDLKKIVFPVIPDQNPSHLTDGIKKLQEFFDAEIFMLWVNTPRIFKTDSEAKAGLQRYAADNNFSNYSVHIRSDYKVESGIFQFAKDIDADMIAMGTHAWKGLAHFFAGSTTEKIVNHADVPIWTYAIR